MGMHTSDNKSGATVIRAVCAALFCAFTFLYLYFYQAEMMAVMQHILSGGVTHYGRAAGAVLITVVLFFVQWGAYAIGYCGVTTIALTYLPSLALLTVLSVMCEMTALGKGLVDCGIAVCASLVGWYVLMRIVRMCGDGGMRTGAARALWKNVLTMALMFILVGLIGGGDDVVHYRAKVEMLLKEGRVEEALTVGRNADATDASLTMLRMYALSLTGRAGGELFTYPITGTGDDIVPMLPTGRWGSALLIYDRDSLYKHLGAIPRPDMDATTFLTALEASGQATDATKDYVLCAALIDKDLDTFATEIAKRYNVNDSLPRHYREALTLYTHLRSDPVTVYHNPVMDTDYDDMRAMERAGDEKTVYRQYNKTYWWYYDHR